MLRSPKCWFEFLATKRPSNLLSNQVCFCLFFPLPTKNTLSSSGNVADWIAAATEDQLCILKQPWKIKSNSSLSSAPVLRRGWSTSHFCLGLHIVLPAHFQETVPGHCFVLFSLLVSGNFLQICRSRSWSCFSASLIPFRLFFFLSLFILRDRAWEGEGQRERKRENPKQAPHC